MIFHPVYHSSSPTLLPLSYPAPSSRLLLSFLKHACTRAFALSFSVCLEDPALNTCMDSSLHSDLCSNGILSEKSSHTLSGSLPSSSFFLLTLKAPASYIYLFVVCLLYKLLRAGILSVLFAVVSLGLKQCPAHSGLSPNGC